MTLPLAALLQGAMAASPPPVGEGDAFAIDLDGTNDYLSRASDFTGNADGKTFTFSAWVWLGANYNGEPIYVSTDNTQIRFQVYYNGSNGFQVVARNSSGGTGTILEGNITSSATAIQQTWVNILISCDMANTSNRWGYVQDIDGSMTFTTYTNDNISFSNQYHKIGINFNDTAVGDFRVGPIFLDYTYRDLSVEANRRYFITAYRKPAASSATLTSGIMYFPMDDPTTAHINSGTGGNMTTNGTIARSGRGPNQFNVPYSDLDGSADYVSKTGALLGSGSKTITFSCAFNPDSVTTDQYLFGFWTSVTTITQIFGVHIGADGSFEVLGQVSPGTGTYILNAGSAAGVLKAGRNYTLQISIDLSDTGKRFVYLNGEAVSMTWTTYTDDYIYLNQASNSPITSAGRSRTFYFNGRLGNVFFHTSYIDLSNAANLAKFVTGTGIDAKPVSLGANGELPTGTAPLVYLPMYANNAGKNYGTGGDFTVNSGPYTGARGPNEFWGNKADFDGSTGYLSRTSALTGVSSTSTLSLSYYVQIDTGSRTNQIFRMEGSNNILRLQVTVANLLQIICQNSAGTVILDAVTDSTISIGPGLYVQMCVDLTNTGKRHLYINGSVVSVTWTTYTSGSVYFSGATDISIGATKTGASPYDGKLSEFYFTTDYIDFSQEANRLLFRDAFGNPTDLPSLIESGAVPNPAVYMRFDPANQGLNSGTGGNFTKSGTITDGGQL